MANMAYCRFQNTLEDLWDCQDHLEDEDLSSDEQKARKILIRVCMDISSYFEED